LAEEDIDILRHSCAHIMAQAVKDIFPETKLGIGPSTKDGFYYDFDLPEPFTPEDLARIEARMVKIIEADLPFKKFELSKEEAAKRLRGEVYKLELLDDIEDERVFLYQQGDFIDLCRGPHVPSTGYVKAFKLLSIAGAYWRGKETNPMLQRIYGAAFIKAEDLDEYLKRVSEAKERDHRKLGRKLDLFEIHEDAGAGLVIYHPKGATLRAILEDFLKMEHARRGYLPVVTPHIYKADLWEISGHCEFYRELMYFFNIGDQEYCVKPMNCPGHVLVYKSHTRSYRDLPLRYFELGTVYRHEKSGVMHGLMRVRGFTQDDGHIFCTPEQLTGEIKSTISFALDLLRPFGFGYQIILSTQPDKFIGSQANWDEATNALREALSEAGLEYEVASKEGAFYGPKIDIRIEDALGRSWQCSTIQVDFNFPEKFDLAYIGLDGAKHRCVMVHRALLGSLERFLGVLIEHYGGAFPVWLAPVQARILTIADRHLDYASRVNEGLTSQGLRVEVDGRNEKVNFKIREAQVQKIPYMLIIGDKELESNTISLRDRSQGDLGPFKVDQFMKRIKGEITKKS